MWGVDLNRTVEHLVQRLSPPLHSLGIRKRRLAARSLSLGCSRIDRDRGKQTTAPRGLFVEADRGKSDSVGVYEMRGLEREQTS